MRVRRQAGRDLRGAGDRAADQLRVSVPVTVEGRTWGALTAGSPGPGLPAGTEDRLGEFTDLVAAAIAHAENGAKLTASRTRVVATADEARRRLRRDLHDGAQQRLVHAIIALNPARDAAVAGDPPGALIAEALRNAEVANRELRDLVRGILPAVDVAGDHLRIDVRDDGRGGADPARGTGLIGSLDRVEAARAP